MVAPSDDLCPTFEKVPIDSGPHEWTRADGSGTDRLIYATAVRMEYWLCEPCVARLAHQMRWRVWRKVILVATALLALSIASGTIGYRLREAIEQHLQS